MPPDSLAKARGIIARAIEQAWWEGYRTAAAEAETALYSGAILQWLNETRDEANESSRN
jgi:hypothetical protein